jgi:phage terminase large subunit-like protein
MSRKRELLLNPKQYDFVFSEARFSFYVGGIGAGKTYAGALRALFAAQQMPGSLGLVGAPTYPMLRDATQRTFFALCPDALVRSWNKTEQHLVFTNGSEILFRSMDAPDRVRGLNLAWAWLDEAPLCGHYAWQLLKGRLRQPGFATSVWATGTPHGRDGYARDFELEPREGHALYRASTRENARNLPPGFIEDLGYTGQFAAQEIEGQFVAFEGLVYSFDADATDGNIRTWPATSADFRSVVGGIDWGYTNPAAAVVFGLDGDGRAWQVDEFYQRRAGLEETVLPAIVALTRRHGVARWYADSEDPEAIDRLNAALAKEGLQTRARAAVKGAGSVRAGIQTVTGLLSKRGDGKGGYTRGLYVDGRCVNTIAEYGTYAYATVDRAKRDASEEPLKQSDHALDASRYALHGELAGAAKTEAYLAAMAQPLRRNMSEEVVRQ